MTGHPVADVVLDALETALEDTGIALRAIDLVKLRHRLTELVADSRLTLKDHDQ